jgi:phosphopantothenoylcysteine decarboxylase/phosphopantothenate--cysteine ligase
MEEDPENAGSLAGQRILLGVTGGIAAYKSADLARRLQDAGAKVRVVMTAAAGEFVRPVTFQALTHYPVASSIWEDRAEAGMAHIELARWATRVLVAPASADFMARLAAGMADDLLVTVCLASEAPLALAPAMNHVMWGKAATRANVALLQSRDVQILGPGEGPLAERESGPGRMLEPTEIVAALAGVDGGALAGVHVLLTAGPTREPIDPVRYISNRSSGKMGFALAAACAALGARVTLVSGPVELATPAGVARADVETAGGMRDAVAARAGDADIFIATAAVSDYAPDRAAGDKIKKSESTLALNLTRTTDILSEVAREHGDVFTVGFAAETRDVAAYARQKLKDKGLGMVAANCVGAGQGFDRDENALQVFWADGEQDLGHASKTELARRLADLIAKRFQLSK